MRVRGLCMLLSALHHQQQSQQQQANGHPADLRQADTDCQHQLQHVHRPSPPPPLSVPIHTPGKCNQEAGSSQTLPSLTPDSAAALRVSVCVPVGCPRGQQWC